MTDSSADLASVRLAEQRAKYEAVREQLSDGARAACEEYLRVLEEEGVDLMDIPDHPRIGRRH